jgi:hypothetical protein
VFAMNKTSRHSLSVTPAADKPTLSSMQKAFNTLIEKIEKKRAALAAWVEAIPAHYAKFATDLLPLKATYDGLRVQFAQRLDQACDGKTLNKTERGIVAELIIQIVGELLANRDDPELKALYNRHSGSDFDTDVAAELEDSKSMLEAVFGVELGDDVDMSSPDEVAERVASQVWEQQEAKARAREENKAKRKKTARQLAAEAKKEAEQEAQQAELSQSVREVYRKLASALHPDRESDSIERERKTALMQRVNQAYARNNLLELLELQLELEHIDQDALKNISQDRLKHYNAILKEQIQELDAEIAHVEMDFKERFNYSPFERVSPKSIMITIKQDIAAMREDIHLLETYLLRMFDDPKKLKVWLKQIKREAEMDRGDDFPFF